MLSLWSGSITFGLVSSPVRVETSQRRQDLSFNFLHKVCKQRVNQKYFCPVCEEYLTREDLICEYEYEKGSYVVLEREDFEKAEGEASRNIEIIAFVDRSRLQPSFLNRTYYLLPQEGAEKGYLLLLKAMSRDGTGRHHPFRDEGKGVHCSRLLHRSGSVAAYPVSQR